MYQSATTKTTLHQNTKQTTSQFTCDLILYHSLYINVSVKLRLKKVTGPLHLRWLITVPSTIQEVDFDGSLLPLFIT